MRWLNVGALRASTFIGLALLGCGPDNAASPCGDGTFFKDGSCVSVSVICSDGTTFNGTECVASAQVGCGEGTQLANGTCIADDTHATLTCGEGTKLHGSECVPSSTDTPVKCGPGTKLDAGTCIPDGSNTTLTCGQGTERDGDTCVAVAGSTITCGDGTELSGTECLPTPTDAPVTCGAGTKLSNGECIPQDSLSCGSGTVRQGNECVAVAGIVCGSGTKLQGNECVPQSTITCGDGTTLSNGACVPVTVTCGAGTHVQGALCVPNAPPVTVPSSETFGFKIAEKGGDVVYFLDQTGTAVYRYDLVAQKFLSAFATSSLTASTMAVTPKGDKVYLGNLGGRIDTIDTATGSTTFLGAGPSTLIWMTVTGDFLYTIDESGAWESHATFSRATGARVFSDEWRNASYGAYYASGIKRIFTFRDGTSPNDIYYEEVNSTTGALSDDIESPYHGDYNLGHPIRVSPDESTVFVASGVGFSTTDLKYKSSIGISYTDLAFAGDRLYLLHPKGSASEVVVMDAKFAILQQFDLPGTPLRLFVSQGKLFTFTRQAAISISTSTL